jgi:hypothetical protein
MSQFCCCNDIGSDVLWMLLIVYCYDVCVCRLCTTLAGESCDLWCITDYTTDKEKIGPIAFNPNNDTLLQSTTNNNAMHMHYYSNSPFINSGAYNASYASYGGPGGGAGGGGGGGGNNSNMNLYNGSSVSSSGMSASSSASASSAAAGNRPVKLKPALFISGMCCVCEVYVLCLVCISCITRVGSSIWRMSVTYIVSGCRLLCSARRLKAYDAGCCGVTSCCVCVCNTSSHDMLSTL